MPIRGGSNGCGSGVVQAAPDPASAGRLETLPARLAALRSWRRALVLGLLGALTAAALPPFHILPAALVGFTGLVWILDGAGASRRALFDGWFFGIGWALAGFSWIANALLVDADRFGWLYPVALLAIGAGFGVFPAVAALAARLVPAGAPRIVALGIAWLVLEWVRSWILTGFPWNLMGTALAVSDAMIQPAAWGGPWLLSAIVLAAALAPAFAAREGALTPKRVMAGLGVSVGLLAATWAAGTWRLSSAGPEAATGPVIRIVQPAIAQADKWRSTLYQSHLATHLALSLSQPAGETPAVIVWPEAAVPHSLLRAPETTARLAAVAPDRGHLLIGAVRIERDAEGILRPYNSLLAFDAGGLVDSYDKHHLVPFGEYVPGRGILPVERIAPGGVDFVPGPGPSVMHLDSAPSFAPLICYEVIFPAGIVGDRGRPAWLLNVTNDAWYGHSTGPYQHFVAARMRAVEQGLPLVRAANTGISGAIDARGRVVASLPLGHRGVLDLVLPGPLPEPTLHARIGDGSLAGLVFLGAAGLVWTLRGRKAAGGRAGGRAALASPGRSG
ncbi:MAG: apolipoprotein N-acyltransferase [Rhodospirillales bacterium]|nr:apolipoprotein N-acyltransferase [Rhodospirillales bacterium]